jgi:hypothetical protein
VSVPQNLGAKRRRNMFCWRVCAQWNAAIAAAALLVGGCEGPGSGVGGQAAESGLANSGAADSASWRMLNNIGAVFTPSLPPSDTIWIGEVVQSPGHSSAFDPESISPITPSLPASRGEDAVGAAYSRRTGATYQLLGGAATPSRELVSTRSGVASSASSLAPRAPDATIAGAGATAICRDGWISYSTHRRGTCSHHGGVSRWLH